MLGTLTKPWTRGTMWWGEEESEGAWNTDKAVDKGKTWWGEEESEGAWNTDKALDKGDDVVG